MIRLNLTPTLARKLDKLATAAKKSRCDLAADLIRGVVSPARSRRSRSASNPAFAG